MNKFLSAPQSIWFHTPSVASNYVLLGMLLRNLGHGRTRRCMIATLPCSKIGRVPPPPPPTLNHRIGTVAYVWSHDCFVLNRFRRFSVFWKVEI